MRTWHTHNLCISFLIFIDETIVEHISDPLINNLLVDTDSLLLVWKVLRYSFETFRDRESGRWNDKSTGVHYYSIFLWKKNLDRSVTWDVVTLWYSFTSWVEIHCRRDRHYDRKVLTLTVTTPKVSVDTFRAYPFTTDLILFLWSDYVTPLTSSI